MSRRVALLVCAWFACGALGAAAAPIVEMRLDFVVIANADAPGIPGGSAALREMLSSASSEKGQPGREHRGTMTVSCESGRYVESAGPADVQAELTASPDAKWIHAAVFAALEGANFVTSINTPPGRSILLAALPDPEEPEARTLLVVATLSLSAP